MSVYFDEEPPEDYWEYRYEKELERLRACKEEEE